MGLLKKIGNELDFSLQQILLRTLAINPCQYNVAVITIIDFKTNTM